MTAESIISPTTVVANGVAVTTAAPLPVTLVGGVSPTTIALGTPLTGGSTNQLLYATSGSVLGEITKANSSVLISNGSGVPAWDTTLPSGLAATNMALTTPSLGVASLTSLSGSNFGVSSSGVLFSLTAAFNEGAITQTGAIVESFTNAASLTFNYVAKNGCAGGGAGTAAIGLNVASAGAGDTSASKGGLYMTRSAGQGCGTVGIANRITTDGASFTTADSVIDWDNANACRLVIAGTRYTLSVVAGVVHAT